MGGGGGVVNLVALEDSEAEGMPLFLLKFKHHQFGLPFQVLFLGVMFNRSLDF